MLPIYDAGYININKQFLTIGLNGVPEAYEILTNKKVGNTKEYRQWVKEMFDVITLSNKEARIEYKHRFNTELIPGENVSVKFAERDKKAGYKEYEIYSSYFYKPEDEDCNMSDKFILHGELGQFMDGGVALHLNLKAPYTTKEQFLQHLKLASKLGLNYWTWNVPRSMCEKCGKIVKRNVKSCPFCGGRKMKHATRVIGFLKFVENFSEGRRIEEGKRIYH
jgi:ribonucleoside-triphosphate reductase